MKWDGCGVGWKTTRLNQSLPLQQTYFVNIVAYKRLKCSGRIVYAHVSNPSPDSLSINSLLSKLRFDNRRLNK